MARYPIDGAVVDTEKATASYQEQTRFDGRNHISLVTGSQWDHQMLYRSRRGRYYLVSSSDWQGSAPYAEWVSPQNAVRWLLTNEYDQIPEELRQYVDEVSE